MGVHTIVEGGISREKNKGRIEENILWGCIPL